MQSPGSGGPATPEMPQTPPKPMQTSQCVSPSGSTTTSPPSLSLAAQVNRLSLSVSRSAPLPYDEDDGPPAKIRAHIDKCRQYLHDGIKEAILKAESFSHQIAHGYDPAHPFSWGGMVKDTRAPTQTARLSATLTSTTEDLDDLADKQFAAFAKLVFSELKEMEKCWANQVGRVERDKNSERSQALQKQRMSLFTDIEALEAALAECKCEHEKTLAGLNTQHESTLADLSARHEKTLADLKTHHEAVHEADERRRKQDLANLQAQFQQEAAFWNAQYQSDMTAANKRTSDEGALRKKVEAELTSTRGTLSAELSKVKGELEGAQAKLNKLQKEMLDDARKRHAEDAVRRNVDQRREREAKQREQDRLRLEKEVAKKEAEMRASHQSMLNAKLEELGLAKKRVGELQMDLKTEIEKCSKILGEKRSFSFQIANLSADLEKAESGRMEAEAKQQAAEDRRQVAEEKQSKTKIDLESAQLAQAEAEKKLGRIQKESEESEKRSKAAVYRRMYDILWAHISGSSLRFNMIGWPIAIGAERPEDLVKSEIQNFVLNPLYGEGKTVREKLREAIRMWHPDKFNQRLADRIAEEDRVMVKDADRHNCVHNVHARGHRDIVHNRAKMKDAYAPGCASYPEEFQETMRDILSGINKIDDELYSVLRTFDPVELDPSSTGNAIPPWVFLVIDRAKQNRDAELQKHLVKFHKDLVKLSTTFDSRVAAARQDRDEALERQRNMLGDQYAASELEVHRVYRGEQFEQGLKLFKERNAFRREMGKEYKDRLAMELKKQREAMELKFAERLQRQPSEVEATANGS
ncbi:hypothetical protein EVG20_g1759 [Dentipellis fragilis]|uniref:Uncharacterized protein n=1 Tax=Dentipellis fragilis TaxID=205917 RepID=A0A4Y9Z8P5_9AGAM|nr:hypothetical protein EVG20_g1759 [Dentipellis fragilis]